MSSTESVLYDVPGPKARRRATIGGIVGSLALLAVLGVVVVRLADEGQFSGELWGPYLNPNNDAFDAVWEILLKGLVKTLQAALLAMALSVVLGTIIAVARLSLGRTGRIPLIGMIELLRGLPVVILIYFGVRVLPDVGIDLSGLPGGAGLWGLVLGLTAYNMVIFAEIIRAGVQSLPRGQNEAGLSIGLSRGQTMRAILLPQAYRTMLPAILSQLVVVLKDTSLVAFVGNYPELLSEGERLVQNLNNPIQTFTVVAVIYIVINATLTRIAATVEARLSRRGAAQVDATEATTTGTGA